MTGDPQDLPGGDVSDTSAARPRIGDPELTPLPGGEIKETADRFALRPVDRRLLVQELVRAALAFSLVLLLSLVIVLAFVRLGSDSWANTKEFLEVIIPALIALLGSAMGFYFGSHQ